MKPTLYYRRGRHVATLVALMLILTASHFVPGYAQDVSDTAAQTAVITVNRAVRYQTMDGWEATAQAGALDGQDTRSSPPPYVNDNPAFPHYKEALFDQVVFDLGLNRLRLEIRCGAENPIDYFDRYRRGLINAVEYRAHRYEIINDDADPQRLNPAGFQFSELDFVVETMVLPMQQRLQTRGEQLMLNLQYGCVGATAATALHRDTPVEYAEFIQAMVSHLQSRYGLRPDGLEIINEPDHSSVQWSATQVGQALVAAGQRLTASGYTPAMIAPASVSIDNAPSYFDTIIQLPGALTYVRMLSYHRYGGSPTSSLPLIEARASQYGVQTAMLEHIGADYHELHQDLTEGRVSAWQQFALAFPTGDNGAQYYTIEQSNPQAPQVRLSSRARYLRQYFRYVRADEVRIDAQTSQSALQPVAFENVDGRLTVVVKAAQAGAVQIQGLPAGVYGVTYTTETATDETLTDVILGSGQPLTTAIPAQGVMTIFGKGGPDATATLSLPAATPTPTRTATPAIPTPCYDVTGDGRVNILDLQAVAVRWSLTAVEPDPDRNPATPNYELRYDVNRDGIINLLDLVLVADQWGRQC